jgi:biopolymer transport protein ExbB/TolQ
MVMGTLLAAEAGYIDLGVMQMTTSTFVILVIFGAIIFGAFVWFLVLLKRARTNACQRVDGLQDVVRVMAAGDHVEQRQAALDRARDVPTPGQDIPELWKDFDSSLVESADGQHLRSTEPAEEYFNTETLAPELLHGRMLSFLPTVMTAVGVLGTFVGLTFGLSGLDLGSGTDSNELRAGVSDLISGAALAFATSMMGVSLSVVANLLHNLSARKITGDIRALQESADRDLHREAADKSLVKIAQYSDEQNKALLALDEKLGVQFQKAVSGLSSDMEKAVTTALEQAIAPALAQLSTAANDQSSQVMGSLIGKFASSFEALGEQQAAKLDTASTQLNTSLESMSDQLNGLVVQMNDAINASLEGSSAQTQRIADQVTALAATLAAQHERTEQVVKSLSELVNSAGRTMTTSSTSLRTATSGLEKVSETFTSTASDLGEHLEATGHVLTSSRNQLDATGTALSTAADRFAEQQEHLDTLQQLMSSTSSSLEKSANVAQSSFGELKRHQDEFVGSVKTSFDELSSSMSQQIATVQGEMRQWLEEYSHTVSQQTAHRMGEWNSQTQAYSSTMVDVASELRELVQDMGEQNRRVNAS